MFAPVTRARTQLRWDCFGAPQSLGPHLARAVENLLKQSSEQECSICETGTSGVHLNGAYPKTVVPSQPSRRLISNGIRPGVRLEVKPSDFGRSGQPSGPPGGMVNNHLEGDVVGCFCERRVASVSKVRCKAERSFAFAEKSTRKCPQSPG